MSCTCSAPNDQSNEAEIQLQDLQDDSLISIASHLHIPALLSLSSCNKALRTLFHSPVLWRKQLVRVPGLSATYSVDNFADLKAALSSPVARHTAYQAQLRCLVSGCTIKAYARAADEEHSLFSRRPLDQPTRLSIPVLGQEAFQQPCSAKVSPAQSSWEVEQFWYPLPAESDRLQATEHFRQLDAASLREGSSEGRDTHGRSLGNDDAVCADASAWLAEAFAAHPTSPPQPLPALHQSHNAQSTTVAFALPADALRQGRAHDLTVTAETPPSRARDADDRTGTDEAPQVSCPRGCTAYDCDSELQIYHLISQPSFRLLRNDMLLALFSHRSGLYVWDCDAADDLAGDAGVSDEADAEQLPEYMRTGVCMAVYLHYEQLARYMHAPDPYTQLGVPLPERPFAKARRMLGLLRQLEARLGDCGPSHMHDSAARDERVTPVSGYETGSTMGRPLQSSNSDSGSACASAADVWQLIYSAMLREAILTSSAPACEAALPQGQPHGGRLSPPSLPFSAAPDRMPLQHQLPAFAVTPLWIFISFQAFQNDAMLPWPLCARLHLTVPDRSADLSRCSNERRDAAGSVPAPAADCSSATTCTNCLHSWPRAPLPAFRSASPCDERFLEFAACRDACCSGVPSFVRAASACSSAVSRSTSDDREGPLRSSRACEGAPGGLEPAAACVDDEPTPGPATRGEWEPMRWESSWRENAALMPACMADFAIYSAEGTLLLGRAGVEVWQRATPDDVANADGTAEYKLSFLSDSLFESQSNRESPRLLNHVQISPDGERPIVMLCTVGAVVSMLGCDPRML